MYVSHIIFHNCIEPIYTHTLLIFRNGIDNLTALIHNIVRFKFRDTALEPLIITHQFFLHARLQTLISKFQYFLLSYSNNNCLEKSFGKHRLKTIFIATSFHLE